MERWNISESCENLDPKNILKKCSLHKFDLNSMPGASNFHGQGPGLTPPPYASWPPTPSCEATVFGEVSKSLGCHV